MRKLPDVEPSAALMVELAAIYRQLEALTAERDRLRAEVARLRDVLRDLGAWRVDL